MNNYQVVSLGSQGGFELAGVRFDGKTFMYWRKKDTKVIEQIMVVFDKKHENIQVQDGVVVLSLKALNDLKDFYVAINIFKNIINNPNVSIHFVVENEKQKQDAVVLGNNLGMAYDVVDMNKKQNDSVNDIENNLKEERNFMASGSKTLEIQNDTGIKKVTVSGDNAYENNGILSIDFEKYILLQEWKKDPYMSSKMTSMSSVEIDRMLTDAVTSNLKAYKMEPAREQTASNKVEEVALNKALNEDGLVNANLGIVENNVSSSSQYSVVSQRGEDVRVVTPSVTSSNINSGGVSSNMVSGNNNYEVMESSMENNNEQLREELNEFYVDDEYNVYDVYGTFFGKIGQDGLLIDYDSNSLMKNDHVIGYIGHYNDMGKNTQKSNKKQNVRVLKKRDENKSAAFVSISVIMFVLSALLLMGSVLLLFVLD